MIGMDCAVIGGRDGFRSNRQTLSIRGFWDRVIFHAHEIIPHPGRRAERGLVVFHAMRGKFARSQKFCDCRRLERFEWNSYLA